MQGGIGDRSGVRLWEMPFIAMVHRHTFSITLVRDSMDDSVLSVKALLSVLGGDQFGFVASPGRLFSVKLASVLTARGGFYESQRARLCLTRASQSRCWISSGLT